MCVTRRRAGVAGGRDTLEHDPDKWVPIFPRDKREAFARRSCSNKKIERDDDSKKSHPALAVSSPGERREPHTIGVVFVVFVARFPRPLGFAAISRHEAEFFCDV